MPATGHRAPPAPGPRLRQASRAGLAATAAGLLLMSGVGTDIAQAHGPCQCTFPTLGRAGALVHVNSRAYKIILNPRGSDFTIEPGGLASASRGDAPTVTVVSRASPTAARRASFRVPRAMPGGVYLLLIYDGSEGGQHYTWDYFQVAGDRPAAAAPSKNHDSSPADGVLAALGGAFLAFGLMGRFLAGRRAVADKLRH